MCKICVEKLTEYFCLKKAPTLKALRKKMIMNQEQCFIFKIIRIYLSIYLFSYIYIYIYIERERERKQERERAIYIYVYIYLYIYICTIAMIWLGVKWTSNVCNTYRKLRTLDLEIRKTRNDFSV